MSADLRFPGLYITALLEVITRTSRLCGLQKPYMCEKERASLDRSIYELHVIGTLIEETYGVYR